MKGKTAIKGFFPSLVANWPTPLTLAEVNQVRVALLSDRATLADQMLELAGNAPVNNGGINNEPSTETIDITGTKLTSTSEKGVPVATDVDAKNALDGAFGTPLEIKVAMNEGSVVVNYDGESMTYTQYRTKHKIEKNSPKYWETVPMVATKPGETMGLFMVSSPVNVRNQARPNAKVEKEVMAIRASVASKGTIKAKVRDKKSVSGAVKSANPVSIKDNQTTKSVLLYADQLGTLIGPDGLEFPTDSVKSHASPQNGGSYEARTEPDGSIALYPTQSSQLSADTARTVATIIKARVTENTEMIDKIQKNAKSNKENYKVSNARQYVDLLKHFVRVTSVPTLGADTTLSLNEIERKLRIYRFRANTASGGKHATNVSKGSKFVIVHSGTTYLVTSGDPATAQQNTVQRIGKKFFEGANANQVLLGFFGGGNVQSTDAGVTDTRMLNNHWGKGQSQKASIPMISQTGEVKSVDYQEHLQTSFKTLYPAQDGKTVSGSYDFVYSAETETNIPTPQAATPVAASAQTQVNKAPAPIDVNEQKPEVIPEAFESTSRDDTIQAKSVRPVTTDATLNDLILQGQITFTDEQGNPC